jgi:broad specificity phosphatase PhoE
MKFTNNYFLLRHGEALSNKKDVVSCWKEKFHNPLTAQGKKEIKISAEKLKKEKIDYFFSSDVLRTKMSAEIVEKKIKLIPKFDKRLREYNVGIYNGVPARLYWEKYQSYKNRFKIKPKNGESYADVSKRASEFLESIEKKYKGKNILIISHQLIIFFLIEKLENLSREELLKKYILSETSVPTGSITISKIKK